MSRYARRLSGLLLIAGLLVIVFSFHAVAADKPAAKGKFEGSGTVEAMSGSTWIVNISDAKWKVSFNADSKLTVTGIAAPETASKMAGALVHFTAEPDAKGKIGGEISDIEMFTMVTEGKGKDKKLVDPKGNYNQSGAVKSAKGNKLVVAVANPETKAVQDAHIDLAEGTLIKINGSFPTLVSVGDLVKLKGDSTVAGQLNATEATVTLSKTVGEKKKPTTPEKKPKPDTTAEK